MGLFSSAKEIKKPPLNERLLEACTRGADVKQVEALVAEGAEVDARKDYETALIKAVEGGHADIVRFLLSKKAAYRPTILVHVRKNAKAVLDALVEHGVDINFMESEGTALHRAVRYQYFDVVQALVEKGADLRIRDHNGDTPETLAHGRKYFGIATYLHEKAAPPPLESGWKLNAPDEIMRISRDIPGHCLMDIFNFRARTYTSLARNLATNAESQVLRFFDEFPDKDMLEEAYDELDRLGGMADKEAIYRPVLKKKQVSKPQTVSS